MLYARGSVRKGRDGAKAFACIVLGALLTTTAPQPAIAAIEVRATLQPPTVQAGEAALLSIEIAGAQDAPAPTIAATEGVRVEYIGPATQVTIINGRMQASVQHRYSVTAEKPGTYRLGPFTVLHGGQRYEAQAVTLHVAGRGQATSPYGGALRLVVRVPRTRLYLREKVPVEVALYVGAVRAGDLQYPSLPADGCALDRFQEPTQTQEEIDGVTYTVVRFASSLTPLRTGTLVLGPATTRLNVYERRRGGFFDDPFFSQRRPVSLESEPVTLEVLPLPEEGKPATFSGAVGRFSLAVQASPTELTVGDPITLRIVLRGQGNLDGVSPPALRESPAWRVYEPHAVNAEAGEFVFEQVAIPTERVSSLPPIEFSYFDPEAGRYHTERSRPIEVTVRPRAESPPALAAPATPTAPSETLGRDIVYIKEEPGRWVRLHERSAPALVAVHGGLLVVPVAAYLFDRRRRQQAADALFQQRTAARKVAARVLAECTAARSAGDPQRFYDVIATGLREYLRQRFALPPGRLDAATVPELPIDPPLRADVARLLEACEEVRFGQQVSAAAVEEHWQLFQRVLEESDGKSQRAWRWRFWLLAWLLCSVARQASAAVPDAWFHQGNSAYAAQDYAAAIAAYEKVVDQGVGSANLFFNLGNAYYKLGNLGKAILNYERAHALAPRDADILANLEFARSEARAPACAAPWWERAMFPLAPRVSRASLWQTASFVYLLALGLWTVAFLHPTWRKRWQQLAVAATFMALAAATNALWADVARPWSRTGITLMPAVARFAPEPQATEYFRLPAGAAVKIRERRGDWLLAQRCDGRRGWVQAREVEALAPLPPHR
ncbi:MAG: BatD family protein [Candidatus Binatia bacterium]|nr:BatD family protein [Candidatus Binatia bacterium]